MDIALGSGATGVFTNSSWLWNKLFEVRITQKHLNYGGDFIPLALECCISSTLSYRDFYVFVFFDFYDLSLK